MSFDWEHYIELAEKLHQESEAFADREACLRSAISRAYYGAFGMARAFAAQEGLTLSYTAQDHVNLKNYFRKSSKKIRRQIGVYLDRMRRLRNKADYEPNFTQLNKEVKKALKSANEVKNNLVNL